MRESDLEEFGVSTGGRIISNLRYADDTAVTVDGTNDPSEALKRLDEAGSRRGLKLNAAKTKWLAVGGMEANVTVAGQSVERVHEFKYLGSIKTGNGSCEKDIRMRIAMAKKRTLELVNIWKDRGIRKEVKIRVVRALVWPVLTYGAEAWTLKAADIKRIKAAEVWVYRRVLRISWQDRRTNISVLEELEARPELVQMVKIRKLSFFGHACRANGLVKEVVIGPHPGQRRRGRPRRSYTDDIKTWLDTTLTSAFRMTEDRHNWRTYFRAAVRREDS